MSIASLDIDVQSHKRHPHERICSASQETKDADDNSLPIPRRVPPDTRDYSWYINNSVHDPHLGDVDRSFAPLNHRHLCDTMGTSGSDVKTCRGTTGATLASTVNLPSCPGALRYCANRLRTPNLNSKPVFRTKPSPDLRKKCVRVWSTSRRRNGVADAATERELGRTHA